ncbi:MAG: DUF5368 domain-containing protein [Alphaproteobacteria bacterium]|nr:DUF5368 domain-containing protein [Alphaproteobacteria bacterium]
MKELEFGTVLAVFEEMFGPALFWLLVAAAVVVTVAYLFVLVRDRSLSLKKFFWAQVSMPFGAIAAVWFCLAVTDSRLSDLGGPIDIVVFLAIAAMGAVGAAILVYTVEALLWPQRVQRLH